MVSYFAVDVTVYHQGFHGDLNETFLVGNVSPEAKKLVRVTSECLMKAISIGKYTGSSTYDQLPFSLLGRKSAIYLLTVFFNLSNLFIIFIELIFEI
jgi:hypothetical protein